jgi:hypothetical protein
MKKTIVSILLLTFLIGCGPSLLIRKDGSIEAKGYHAITQKVDGTRSYISKPWWSLGFVKDLVGLVENLFKGAATVISPTPTPTPTPVPTPTPTPRPGPTPVPVPTPTPVTNPIIIADLPLVAQEMGKAGFVGREAVQLYALMCAWAGRGWACDPVDGECIALQAKEAQIQAWFESRVVAIEAKLKADPNLTATIIANDAKDRFGEYIGRVIATRLSAYSSRLTMGTVVPETSY